MINTIREEHSVCARKSHKCDCCEKEIAIGEVHDVGTYAQDGTIFDWRICSRCRQYVDEAFANPEYDFSDGMSGADFWNYMYTEHMDIAEQWQQQKG